MPDVVHPLTPADRAHLDTLIAASPVVLPATLWELIAAAYNAPARHYHTLQHLAGMAEGWREVAAGPGWTDPRSSWLALLFHDVVYDVGAHDNEARSAALLLAHFPEAEPAARLIRLTAAHGAPSVPLDADAAHFLDCDLGILAAPPERFASYEAQVAAEYAPVVPPEAYRAGRRAFLAQMLALPRIFHSEHFHARLDARARANLSHALAAR